MCCLLGPYRRHLLRHHAGLVHRSSGNLQRQYLFERMLRYRERCLYCDCKYVGQSVSSNLGNTVWGRVLGVQDGTLQLDQRILYRCGLIRSNEYENRIIQSVNYIVSFAKEVPRKANLDAL